MNTTTIIAGDVRKTLTALPSESVDCVVTSPPYWSLRDYGVAGQIGLEPTFAEYITALRAVFDEVRRVLVPDGTLWLNMGDSYVRDPLKGSRIAGKHGERHGGAPIRGDGRGAPDIEPKNLLGQPWRLAFALQDAGWILRSDIIWAKPNAMPESVTDRPTKAHEYVFLFSKSERYFFDGFAIKEKSVDSESHEGFSRQYSTDHLTDSGIDAGYDGHRTRRGMANLKMSGKKYPLRNARTVWTIPTSGFSDSHFAAFPPELARRCILAGCPASVSRVGADGATTTTHGVVLDPFGGAGTTAMVANNLGRDAILCELNDEYIAMTKKRLGDKSAGLFSRVVNPTPDMSALQTARRRPRQS